MSGRESRGTVLVIDDEQSVRELTSRILTRFGYEVLTASDGPEGITEFQSRRDAVDVVVLDMTMPEMHGSEVLDTVRGIRDDVPVILTSGYQERDVVDALTARKRVAFLQKPFQRSALIGLLEELMAE